MKGAQKDLAGALNGAADAFLILDDDWRFTYLNSEAERILTQERGSLVGKELREALPEAVGLTLYRELCRAAAEWSTADFRLYHPELDRWFEVRAHPIDRGLLVCIREANRRREKWLGMVERALEASSAGALITDATLPDNPIVYVNQALQRMTGYAQEEMLGDNCRFLQGVDREQPGLDELREAIRAGEEWQGVLRNYRKDGTLFCNELYISPVKGENGRITHYLGVQNDVTASVQARGRDEEALVRQSAAIQSSMDGICISGPGGNLIYLNQAHAELYGYAVPDEMVGMNWQDLYGEERVRWFEHHVVPALMQEGSWRGEAVGVGRDGGEFPQELSLSLLEDGGTVCVVRDISERRRAEQAIAKSESRMEEAQKIAGLGSWEWSPADGSLTWSREQHRIFGVEPEDFGFGLEALLGLVHPEDREKVRDGLWRSAGQPGVTEHEYRIVRPDGEVRLVSSRWQTERDESGEPSKVQGTTQDVTERRRGEEARLRLASIVEHSEEAIVANTLDGLVTNWNPAAHRLFGYEAGEIIGKPVGILVPEEGPEALESVRRVSRTGLPEVQETVRVTKDGTRVEVSITRSPIRDASGNITGTSSICTDISRRKAAEHALAESEARFRNLVELSPDAIFVHGEGILLYINPAGARLLGADRTEEIIGEPVMSLIHPDHRDAAQERIGNIMSGGSQMGPAEEEFLRLDGGSVEVEVTGRMVTYEGRPAVQSLARDITERKQSEEALRRERNLLRTVMDSTRDAIFAKDTEHRFRLSNAAHQRILGTRSQEDLLGKTNADYWGEKTTAPFYADDRRVLDGGESIVDREEKVRRASGEEMWLSTTKVPLQDSDGDIEGLVAVARDITERRREQYELSITAARLGSLIRNMPSGVLVEDEQRNIRHANAAFTRMFEMEATPEEITRDDCDTAARDVMHLLADPEGFVARIEEILVEGRAVASEEIPLADGQVYERDYVPVYVQGEYRGHMWHYRDLTERKRSEKALRQSEERFRTLFDQAAVGVAVTGLDRNLIQTNAAYQEILGYGAEELVGMSTLELTHPDDRAGDASLVKRFLEYGEETYLREKRLIRKDGEVIWAKVTSSLAQDERGEPSFAIGVIEDITARKQAQEARRQSEESFRALFDQTAVGVCVADLDRRLLQTNEAYQKITGYSEEELVGMSTLELTHPEDRSADTGNRRTFVSDYSDSYRRSKRYVRKDGAVIWAEATSSLVRDEEGEPRFIMGVVEDVTERRKAQQALAESESLLRSVTSGAPVILFATDLEGVITLAEGKALESLGLEPGAAVGEPAFEAYANIPGVVGNLRRALAGEEVASSLELSGIAFEARYSPMRDGSGGITGSIGVATNVTDRRELEKTLEHRAFHDALTGLPNRALFMDRLKHALTRTSRRGEQVAVLFLDLDDFKHVNDSLGHSAGDRLLIEAGRRIGTCLRQEDTVARLGGDEFAVLLEEVPDPDFPTRLAQRIATEIRRPISLSSETESPAEGPEVAGTLSLGIALSQPEDGSVDAEELLQMADAALYTAKDTGKDHHEAFRQEMKDHSAEVLKTSRDLRLALEREEFVLHYQPKVDLSTGEVSGLEALIRWQHPERGLVYPDEFIPLAEENGLIVPLGRQVLREACRQAKVWQDLHPAQSGETALTICVNVSVRQFRSPDILKDVAAALSDTGIAPSSLVLEITESIIIERDRYSISMLNGLRDLGVQLAIDDFGSGYSSLSYLKNLPVDVLKIDRSLVSGMGSDAANTAIVSAAVTVAHALGLQTVAEGVENESDLEEAKRLGCDFGQGYHWLKPAPAGEISALL